MAQILINGKGIPSANGAQLVEGDLTGLSFPVWDGEKFIDDETRYNDGLRESTALYVRSERDRLLVASDWTQIADVPVDKEAWAAYRQALRDIPNQEGFPMSVVWPTKP